MANSTEQLEKNVSTSFGYVKKDMLMVNDSVSELHDKIQHLSMNQAMLLEKMSNIEKLLSPKKSSKPVKKELKFYDVKAKEGFYSNEYKLTTIKGRKFAVAKSPSGNKAYRIMGGKVASKKVVKKAQKKKVAVKSVSKKTVSKTPKKVVTETVLYE